MTDAVMIPRLRTAIFELANTEPRDGSRAVLWSICALFGVLLVWASVAQLDIVAVAEGRLVPETYVKIVQPSEAGIVREILVKEGESVRRGQPLLRLDPTLAAADRRSVGGQLDLKRLDLRRIDAQLSGRSLATLTGDDPMLLAQVRLDATGRERAHLDEVSQAQSAVEKTQQELLSARETLSKLERTLPSYETSAAAYEKLAKDKLIGSLAADEKRREATERSQDHKAQVNYVASLEASLQAARSRLSQLRSAYRSTLQSERVQVLGQISQLQEEANKQGFREGLLELRAPQDGVVKDVATTTVGAVVQPGAVLLTLVPKEEPLLAEVYIRNEDVGFVSAGQSVRIKLSAYPFTKYGMLEGTVHTLSADASQGGNTSVGNIPQTVNPLESNRSPFKALVRLNRQTLEVGGMKLPALAGMQVQAEIMEGKRTVLEYLLSPVRRVTHESASER